MWNYDSTMLTNKNETVQEPLDGDLSATALQEPQTLPPVEQTTDTHQQPPPDDEYVLVKRGRRELLVQKAFNMNSGGPRDSIENPTTTNPATLVEYTGIDTPPPAELYHG